MKTVLAVFVVCAAALTPAFVPSAVASHTPATAYRVSAVNIDAGRAITIHVGSTRREVLQWMGRPARQPSADVWIHHGYQAPFDEANRRGCRSIVITFVDDRVADLKLVNSRAVAIIAAKRHGDSSDVFVTAK